MWALVEGQWSASHIGRSAFETGFGFDQSRSGYAFLKFHTVPGVELLSSSVLPGHLTCVLFLEQPQGLRNSAEFIQFWIMSAGCLVTPVVRKARMAGGNPSIEMALNVVYSFLNVCRCYSKCSHMLHITYLTSFIVVHTNPTVILCNLIPNLLHA
jgi:hypothetical protein